MTAEAAARPRLAACEHSDSGWFTWSEVGRLPTNTDVRAWVKKAAVPTSGFARLMASSGLGLELVLPGERRSPEFSSKLPTRLTAPAPFFSLRGDMEKQMPAIVHQFMCLDDNFGVLVHDSVTGATASIDVPEGAPVLNALSEIGWTLTHILVTHHHKDPIGGVDEVRRRFPDVEIIGPAPDRTRVPGAHRYAGEGDVVKVGALSARVIETPGHTSGHVCYNFYADGLLFAGDTLYTESVVVEKRLSSSRPGQGIVKIAHTGRNQDGTVVATAVRSVLVHCLPEGPAA
jgi:hypothetical protein